MKVTVLRIDGTTTINIKTVEAPHNHLGMANEVAVEHTPDEPGRYLLILKDDPGWCSARMVKVVAEPTKKVVPF